MDTVTKTGIDTAKTASKMIVQKTAEATGDLIENKQLIQSLQQVNQKEKQKKFTFHRKKDKLLMILNCFEHEFDLLYIKMKFQKITNFLDTTSDDKDIPRFVTKKWIKVYDQSGRNCYRQC